MMLIGQFSNIRHDDNMDNLSLQANLHGAIRSNNL